MGKEINTNEINEIEQQPGVAEVVYYSHSQMVRAQRINKETESFMRRFTVLLEGLPLSTEHRGQILYTVKEFVDDFTKSHQVNINETLLDARERHLTRAGADILGQAVNCLIHAENATTQSRKGIESLIGQIKARDKKPEAA